MIFSSIISCFPHPRFPLSSAQSCQRDLTLSQVLLHCCSHLLDRYWHTNAGCILYLENNTRGSSLLMQLMMQCRCALCSQLLFFFTETEKLQSEQLLPTKQKFWREMLYDHDLRDYYIVLELAKCELPSIPQMSVLGHMLWLTLTVLLFQTLMSSRSPRFTVCQVLVI